MRKTSGYGLVLYDPEDKMIITANEDSLNRNMELIDEALTSKITKDEIKDMCILTDEQLLDEAQQKRARDNINAASPAELNDMIEQAVTENGVSLDNYALKEEVFEVSKVALFENKLDVNTIKYNTMLDGSGEEVGDNGVGLCVTDYIPIKKGDIIRMKDFAISNTASSCIMIFNSNLTYIAHKWGTGLTASSYYFSDIVLDSRGWCTSITVPAPTSLAYVRICTLAGSIGKEPIITINEEINYEMTLGGKFNTDIKIEYSQLIDAPGRNCWDILPNEHLNIAYSEIRSGGKPLKPINTAEHFINACSTEYSYNVLKCDVQPTSDGELVLCHDAGFTADANKVLTTYDSNNCVLINTLTAAECLEYTHSSGEHVCLIGDFLKICRRYGKVAFITIRELSQMAVVIPKLLNELKKYNMLRSTIINSLNYGSLQEWRKYDKSVMLNYTLAYGAAIDEAAINSVLILGYCSLGGFGMDGNTPINECNFEYAQENGIRLINAIAYYDGSAENCYDLGYDGCQLAYPYKVINS